MDKAVKLLQLYESKAEDKYRNASRKEAKPANARLEDRDRDRDFRNARKLYHQKRSSLEQYHGDVLNVFSFKPKAKYIQNVVDTDDSDVSDGGVSSSDDDNNDEHNQVVESVPNRIHREIEEELDAFFSD